MREIIEDFAALIGVTLILCGMVGILIIIIVWFVRLWIN